MQTRATQTRTVSLLSAVLTVLALGVALMASRATMVPSAPASQTGALAAGDAKVAENAAAKKVYTNLGFKVEGVLREAFVLGSRRLDALYMGLLAAEFATLETEDIRPNG